MTTGPLPPPRARAAVVTGGASGIGLAIAGALAAQGYGYVALLDVVDPARGRAVAAALQADAATPTVVDFVPCDVADWASQTAAFAHVRAACQDRGGLRLDVVAANAGISEGGTAPLVALARGPSVTEDDDDDDAPPAAPSLRTLDINLVGVLYTVHQAIHWLKKNPPLRYSDGDTDAAAADGPGPDGPLTRGTILCTASNAGLYAFPTAPLYAASKFGVVGLVRSLARVLDDGGDNGDDDNKAASPHIQIHALAPAVLQTNIAPSPALFAGMPALTPMATLTRAVDALVRDRRAAASGSVVEVHGTQATPRPPHAFVDDDSRRNLEVFWSMGVA